MTTTQTRTEGMVGVQRRTGGAPRSRRFVGGLFLCTSGIHVGIVAADPSMYRTFADHAVFQFVEDAWRDVFMATPVAWGLAVAGGELLLGLLLLRGGVAARLGWVGVIAFHVLLVFFGWGFLFWSGPVLTLLVWAAVRDWRTLGLVDMRFFPVGVDPGGLEPDRYKEAVK